MMKPRLRKLALVTHVAASVGWVGSIGSFLALAVTGFNSDDVTVMRSVYLSMELIAWYAIVPLSIASLATGLVQSLGTSWGLFRHYWIVAKLIINVLSSLLLFVHMQPVGRAAAIVAQASFTSDDLGGLRAQLVADSIAAIVALLVATGLSIYKPKGLTSYGRRIQKERTDN